MYVYVCIYLCPAFYPPHLSASPPPLHILSIYITDVCMSYVCVPVCIYYLCMYVYECMKVSMYIYNI